MPRITETIRHSVCKLEFLNVKACGAYSSVSALQ